MFSFLQALKWQLFIIPLLARDRPWLMTLPLRTSTSLSLPPFFPTPPVVCFSPFTLALTLLILILRTVPIPSPYRIWTRLTPLPSTDQNHLSTTMAVTARVRAAAKTAKTEICRSLPPRPPIVFPPATQNDLENTERGRKKEGKRQMQ